MSLKETVLKNRSYRRFYQDRKVSVKELEELVDIARNVASGANRQPLRYKVVCDASDNEKVFSTLKQHLQTGTAQKKEKSQQDIS